MAGEPMSEHHPDTESYEISSAPAPHPVTAEIPRQWAQVLGLLRKDLGESTYQNWLCFIGCEGVEGGCAQMTAPSRFKRDWISSHLGDQILKAWGAVNGQVLRLDFLIRETAAAQGSRDADGAVSITALTPATISATARNDIQADMRGGQYGRIGAPLDPRLRLRISSSENPMNSLMRPPAAWPIVMRRPSIRCFCMAAWGWEKPI